MRRDVTTEECGKTLVMHGVDNMGWPCILPVDHDGKCEPERCGLLVRRRFCDMDRYWPCKLPKHHPGKCY